MTGRKKMTWLLTVMLLMFHAASALCEGFATDLDAIEKAAQSVFKLSVWDWDKNEYSTGSGFIAFDDKTLVTNYHVIEAADTIYAESEAGQVYFVKTVIAADRDMDIALLEFTRPTGMAPLPLHDTGELRRAEPVVAIGSPQGVKNAVSLGNLGAVYEESGVTYIQSTAQTTFGSSGGALFDGRGRVIGVTTLIIEGAQGLNLAVHIKQVVSLKEANWENQRMTLKEFHEKQESDTSNWWEELEWPVLPELPKEDREPLGEVTAQAGPFGVTLSWDAEVVVEQFYVYRADSADGEFALVGASDTGSFFDMKVMRGRTYYYKVGRVLDGQVSEMSQAAAALVPALP